MADIFDRYRPYFRQRPVIVTVLTILAVAFFLLVTGLSRIYYAQRDALGTRWYQRGVSDLKANNYGAAVTDFRTALLYSRDNFSYQMNLAEALVGMHHLGEASAYLLNLWDREPENGVVNLDLARIAAQQGRTDEAIRYYHNAVYAVWPANEETRRREARQELIELLLRNREWTQAQAELIALSANAGGDTELQQKIGDLFARAGDYEHALEAYRVSLRADRRNAAALAGAGEAGFELGRYAVAQRYLQEAIAANPNDKQSAERLQTTEMVLDMDPFGRQVSSTQKDRLVVDAFATAGQRLTACPDTKPANDPDNLSTEWAEMNPKVSAERLRREPELAEPAMDLVFQIERETSVVCGMPEGKDLALLLIGKLHEGG